MLARRSKRAVLALLAVVAVVLVALSVVARYFEALEQKRRLGEERASLKVREDFLFTVEPRTVERERRYAAAVEPWLVADVPAEVAGRVAEVKVEAGSRVVKDAEMVILDNEIATIDWQRAVARLEEVKRLLGQAEQLSRNRVVSQTEVDALRSEARIAAAEEAGAKARLDRHVIRAPFEGSVLQRLVQVGEAVNVNESVVKLVDVSRLRVIFFVNERDVPSFPAGKIIQLRLPALPGEVLEVPVVHVAQASDESTRLFQIEGELPNAGEVLRGGLTGEASAKVELYKERLFIPTACARLEGGAAYVLRVRPDEAGPETVRVRVGEELDGFYPVLEGLSAGDRLLVR